MKLQEAIKVGDLMLATRKDGSIVNVWEVTGLHEGYVFLKAWRLEDRPKGKTWSRKTVIATENLDERFYRIVAPEEAKRLLGIVDAPVQASLEPDRNTEPNTCPGCRCHEILLPKIEEILKFLGENSRWKMINATSYEGFCDTCKTFIPKGSSAWWRRSPHAIACPGCRT